MRRDLSESFPWTGISKRSGWYAKRPGDNMVSAESRVKPHSGHDDHGILADLFR
jgi:hypothetical protein